MMTFILLLMEKFLKHWGFPLRPTKQGFSFFATIKAILLATALVLTVVLAFRSISLAYSVTVLEDSVNELTGLLEECSRTNESPKEKNDGPHNNLNIHSKDIL